MSAEAKKTIVALFDGGENVYHYDQITKELEAAGLGNPEGRLYHVAYGTEGGYRVVDVWESSELLDQFAQRLTPIIQKMGGTPAQRHIYPVHNVIKG